MSGEDDPARRRRDENFPVASILIARRLRGPVRAFYAFAREADDIADDPGLSEAEKLARLEEMARAWDETAKRHGIAPAHGRDLLAAFRMDAVKHRYASWDEVMAYCRLSAVPCARALLDLHGERDAAARSAAAALAAALQVLDHLQDCGPDYRRLGRAYLPLDWCAAAGADIAGLARGELDAPLREVIERMLDGADRLLAEERDLPLRLGSVRLALEAAVALAFARALAAELRRADPLARRVALGRARRLGLCAMAVARTLAARARQRLPSPLAGRGKTC